MVTHRYLRLLGEAQHLGVEALGLVLVVDHDAGEIDPHRLSFSRTLHPAIDERLERVRLEIVELVAALAPRADQARSSEQIEVLRDTLTSHRQTVLGRQA